MPDSTSTLIEPVRPVSRAQAARLGITVGRLRGPGWRSPYRDVHVPTATDQRHPFQRILEAAPLLPAGGALGGWAAAYLLGIPYFDGRTREGIEPITLCVGRTRSIASRDGIEVSREALDDVSITLVHGFPVTTAIKTCSYLMRHAADLTCSVIAADMMLNSRRVDRAALTARLQQDGRRRGIPLAREALALADGRSASPWETRSRLIWVVDAGLPRPAVNVPLFSLGRLMGVADMLDVEAGVVWEFDGSDHRELRQHTQDNAREEDFERSRLLVVLGTSLDVGPLRVNTAERMRLAWNDGMARDRHRDRWTLTPPRGSFWERELVRRKPYQ